LLNLALRQNCKDLLTTEKVKLEAKIKEMKLLAVDDQTEKVKVLPLKTLTSYAWDQSDKFVKIYLSDLKGIQSIPTSNIELTTGDADSHYSVFVKDLNGKNVQFTSPKLLHEISSFSFKVKEDMLLLMLRKKQQQKWTFLSKREQEAKEQKEKLPPMSKDESQDPQASIMNMMKKMYDEGDDEMKKNIAKAWTESSNKRADVGSL